jgi:hypothetical protein
MLREFMIPLVTLCCMVIAGIASLDKLCLFHQTYQSVSAKLESERWLLEQCSDALFFSRMHTHSDLCFQVLPTFRCCFVSSTANVCILMDVCFVLLRSRTMRGWGLSC